MFNKRFSSLSSLEENIPHSLRYNRFKIRIQRRSKFVSEEEVSSKFDIPSNLKKHIEWALKKYSLCVAYRLKKYIVYVNIDHK